MEATNSWGHKADFKRCWGRANRPGAGCKCRRARLLAAIRPAVTFPETGQALQGRFLDYWRSNGGLAVFGYPIGAQSGAPLSQAFERTRFEYHPQNAAPYDVLLGRLGAEALEAQGRNWRDFATVTERAAAGCSYFAETGHSLCGAFKSYWERHGLEFDGQRGSSYAESLALFGMPLGEPQMETNADGATVMVQWFERVRFEYHPQNAAPYDVLLGRLGSEVYKGGETR